MSYKHHRDSLVSLINDLSNEDSAIIVVEGKRDFKALTSLGIQKERILQCAQHPERELEQFIMTCAKKVIPLFDADRTGRIRAQRFSRYFQGQTLIDRSYAQRLINLGFTYTEEMDDRAVY